MKMKTQIKNGINQVQTLSHTSARITSMKNERKKNGHIGMNTNETRPIVFFFFFFIYVLYVFKYLMHSITD